MKRACFLLALALVAAGGCRRRDVRTVTLAVPDMADDRAARIVCNAICIELARNDANIGVSLKEGTLQLSANAVLMNADLQSAILKEAADVGLSATLAGVKPAPSDHWPDRHVLVLRIAGMQTNQKANIAVGAVTRAMNGQAAGDVRADPAARRVTVTYDSMFLGRKNLEHAVANAGFRTDRIPVNLGFPDALPHGWSPL
jgi:hypothetical protein